MRPESVASTTWSWREAASEYTLRAAGWTNNRLEPSLLHTLFAPVRRKAAMARMQPNVLVLCVYTTAVHPKRSAADASVVWRWQWLLTFPHLSPGAREHFRGGDTLNAPMHRFNLAAVVGAQELEVVASGSHYLMGLWRTEAPRHGLRHRPGALQSDVIQEHVCGGWSCRRARSPE